MSHSTDSSLYEISVDTLGISEKSIELLRTVGMESVGDCVDFYRRGSDATIQVPSGLLEAFEANVLPLLQEHGYLSDIEDQK